MPAGNAEAAGARDSQGQGLNHTFKCVSVIRCRTLYFLGRPVPNNLTSAPLSRHPQPSPYLAHDIPSPSDQTLPHTNATNTTAPVT